MPITIADFSLKNERSAATASQRAKLLGTLVDLPENRKNAFGRAVQEIAQNTIQYCGGGRISYRINASVAPPLVEATITDDAKGSTQINAILSQTAGPDCGLLRASRAADQLILETVDDGTKQIRIGMVITEQAADVDESDVAGWAGILRTRRIQSALGSTQRRSRELAQQLAGIQRQRQELAAELEQSRSINEALTLLSLVASKTDNAVVIMNAEGLITWVNDAFIRMTGYAIQDASGARPDQLLGGPNTDRESIQEFEQAFRLGHGVSEELLQYHREGTTSWISLSLTPVHNDEGRVTRWIGIGSDITKRKEAERALETARNAAENASQLKGEFLANISHEIRTPMNAIIGMTDLTLCTDLDMDQREYLSTVKQSAEALLELLNDVLDLSRIEAGRLDIVAAAFEFRSAVHNTLKPLMFVAEQQGLKLTVNIGADVPDIIVSDALRLRQILINLVGNAIKFTAAGSVEVNVQKQWAADNEVGLEFVVTDTGIGISAAKLDHIFEAFSQADSSITRDFGGTGLGLTITSQLLKLMNGRVWVQSEIGRGSRFHFTLRCRLPDTDEVLSLKQRREAAAATIATNPFEHQTRPLNILVADDHPANRQLIARILQKRGHAVHFANNGTEVLQQFTHDEFDIILMDVQMPGMDGYQATAAIRERERITQAHIPIIAVTAHAMQGQREECLSAGMDAYLSKPVKTLELLILIDSLVDNDVNVSVTSATSTGYVATEDPPAKVHSTAFSHQVNYSSASTAEAAQAKHSGFSEALKRLDNDDELLREQMQFFLKDGPELMAMIMAAMSRQDRTGLQIAAHRLKNLCATFDDNESAALCGQLEFQATTGKAMLTSELAKQIEDRVERLLASIRKYCGM
jgi:PAS domain S-box-containing protein